MKLRVFSALFLLALLPFSAWSQTNEEESEPPLWNLSSRLELVSGGVSSHGFVIGGEETRQILIRAVGPGLAQFDIENYLSDPALTLYDSDGEEVDSNDDWPVDFTGVSPKPIGPNSGVGASIDYEALFEQVGAFELQPLSFDAALSVELEPGIYTVAVGASSFDPLASGEVILEIYLVE